MKILFLTLALSANLFAAPVRIMPRPQTFKNNPVPFCGSGVDIVTTEYADNGCSVATACVLKSACPKFPAPPCEDGKLVSPGYEKNGCDKPPVCVTTNQCVSVPAPPCANGKIVYPGYENNGCKKAPVCVTPDLCKPI